MSGSDQRETAASRTSCRREGWFWSSLISRISIGEGAADSYAASVFRIGNIYDMATRYGAELGIHHPTVEQSIAAINLARSSDLTVMVPTSPRSFWLTA